MLAYVLSQAVLQLVLRERRVLCATLHVDVSNAAALGLYRKAGFVEVRLLLPAGNIRLGVVQCWKAMTTCVFVKRGAGQWEVLLQITADGLLAGCHFWTAEFLGPAFKVRHISQGEGCCIAGSVYSNWTSTIMPVCHN
jgi:hypothetical protein